MSAKSTRPRDFNQLAKFIADVATGDAVAPHPDSNKNPAAVSLGRLGGLKGGKARAERLSQEQRLRIAKKAAAARWGIVTKMGGRMRWRKTLSRSDAQQKTKGAKMPFLRLTKGSIAGDHTSWFRENFFGDQTWVKGTTPHGHGMETTKVKMHVVLAGDDLGVRTMRLDHIPVRAGNHNAPTTHLHYDNKTRQALEDANLAGRVVVLERDAHGAYSLSVD